jgi:sec-independent protein translocase protein TatA
MGSFSAFHWILVALVVLVLFGRGRISEVMGDFGKGITSFKKGLSEAEKMPEERPAQRIAPPAAPPAEGPAAPARTPEEEAAAKRDPG